MVQALFNVILQHIFLNVKVSGQPQKNEWRPVGNFYLTTQLDAAESGAAILPLMMLLAWHPSNTAILNQRKIIAF